MQVEISVKNKDGISIFNKSITVGFITGSPHPIEIELSEDEKSIAFNLGEIIYSFNIKSGDKIVRANTNRDLVAIAYSSELQMIAFSNNAGFGEVNLIDLENKKFLPAIHCAIPYQVEWNSEGNPTNGKGIPKTLLFKDNKLFVGMDGGSEGIMIFKIQKIVSNNFILKGQKPQIDNISLTDGLVWYMDSIPDNFNYSEAEYFFDEKNRRVVKQKRNHENKHLKPLFKKCTFIIDGEKISNTFFDGRIVVPNK